MSQSADDEGTTSTMKALVYHGPNNLALEEWPKPTIIEAYDTFRNASREHAIMVLIGNTFQ